MINLMVRICGYRKEKKKKEKMHCCFHNSKKSSAHFRSFGTFVIWTVAVYCCSTTTYAESNVDKAKDDKFFLKELFRKYGSNDVMTIDGFEHLLQSIGLERLMLHHRDNASEITDSNTDALNNTRKNEVVEFEKGGKNLKPVTVSSESVPVRNRCLLMSEIMTTFDIEVQQGSINHQQFSNLCPAIIYELDHQVCNVGHNDFILKNMDLEDVTSYLVWIYAAVAVIIISLSGLVVVAIIPIMRGSFYNVLLQFLVAMAVGSLVGDALLHLLPHALASDDQHEWQGGDSHKPHHHHESSHQENSAHVDDMIWKGLVAVIGILIFFMAERLLTLLSTRRKLHSTTTPGKNLLQDDVEMTKTGEKLCKHNKYNSYGFCYGEVTMDMLKGLNESSVCEDKDHHNCLEKASQTDQEGKEYQRCQTDEVKNVGGLRPIHGEGDHFDDTEAPWNNGVIVAQHEHRHHGHSHTHTHTHTMPSSISSVAWMVIMGDGLHNFSDGLAIGAAFSSSITGGVSTSIAVLCHELPHELGDFAVLLRSGMTAKQALAYNGLSSVLCFMGMLLGVVLGNVASVTSWIFAGAAGMFIYIALVDMVPELNSVPSVPSGKTQKVYLSAQFLGMSIGVTIMLLIALYEHDLQKVLHYT